MENIKENALQPCFVLLEPITPKSNLNFSEELKKVIDERNILTTKTRRCVLDALDEITNKNETENRLHKKENALMEIITTEKSYVHQLEIILEYFMKPTQEKNLLRSHDFKMLFGNISTIYNINKELLEELSKDSRNIANAFNKIAPFFKLYSVYACEFKSCLQILEFCPLYNAKFAKFLEMQESRPEVQSKLSALLITPIQRVPRYKLLISQLFNLTLPIEKEYTILQDCLNKIEEAASHINKVIIEQENMQRLLELQRCIIGHCLNIIVPGRKLIKEGILMAISSKTGHSQKCYVVIMSDIIMFCKMKKAEVKVNSLKCDRIFPLNKCKVIEILDKGSFKIVCQSDEIVLYHEELTETKNWIEIIKESIQCLLDDRKTLKKESSDRRPVKRKNLSEYNEVGLSPGRPLKKRKSVHEELSPMAKTTITRRRPIRSFSNNLTNSPLQMTLKPEVSEKRQNMSIVQNDEVCKDLFVFGAENENKGFGFKFNRLFGGIKNSVKTFFGFK